MTGCLRPAPADNLLILAGIQPAELRRNGATLSLARRAMESGHLLHTALTFPPSANARRLKSRHSFVLATQPLNNSTDDTNRSVAFLTDQRCNAEWLESTTRLRTFSPISAPSGFMGGKNSLWGIILDFRRIPLILFRIPPIKA